MARSLLVSDAMNFTVLIVDDDTSVRRGLGSVLEAVGLSVVSAAGLAEAEAALGTGAVDFVLADLSLVGADGREGLELAERVRALGLSVPVVVFTAHGNDGVRAEALARGAHDLWSKAWPIEELLERMIDLARPRPPADR